MSNKHSGMITQWNKHSDVKCIYDTFTPFMGAFYIEPSFQKKFRARELHILYILFKKLVSIRFRLFRIS